ncbi:hypothetical protein B9Z19DRAFT_1084261 [Tuber borchii]|uniref:Uncharacterized protein n=1 Tax=Tuber borchii TaxID=42251 RepID=A0A2T6ZS86_TUBBO|nr:hypothetical protein B9Z19DRAFT_1084261 [Tuber borchii]
MDYSPRMASGDSRYFVSPSDTGMLEDRVPVLLKAWDTQSNLAIFQPASVGPGQRCHYEHIGIENLVEDHELLPTHSNQIYSSDSIAAVGYIHVRPKPQEESEPDDLAHRTSYLSSNGGKDTRILTVCSINQVRQFIEANDHTNNVLKANCLFPQSFYGSPCITKQSGFVIGVVNGPHSATNTGNINLFPRGFKESLRWYTSKVDFPMVE